MQAGLLAGLGLAFVGGVETTTVRAAPNPCQLEATCTFKRPLFAILLDSSSSMNAPFGANSTRWEAAVQAIKQLISFDNGYMAENSILGLIRFGHDPDPLTPGTTIPGDGSGLVDGQRLDVPWYDPNDPDKAFIECTNGDAISAALDALGPPAGGIGSWTRGAIDFAAAYIAQTEADHPQDMNKRPAVLVVITDGPWTNPSGTMLLAPADQDPKIPASELWMKQGIPTHVVALGDAVGTSFADALASAGGTSAAIDAADPQGLTNALKDVALHFQYDVVTPACAPGLPRIMVLLDASSSMLNINSGTQHAPAGMGGWDQVRDALAGWNSLFDVLVDNPAAIEDVTHFGLSVFGHNTPGEAKLVVQYGPCQKDNFDWALDPATSCEAPGCTDPYGKPPILWTFKDGSVEDPPNFAAKTISHMPRCDLTAQLPNACVGSGTYTHLGLDLVQSNLATYKNECSQMGAPHPCNDDTVYVNILITDGIYNSTDAQVQAPLTAMYEAGVTTHVIGFGEILNTDPAKKKLNNMADWGSGNTLDYYDANNQDQLEGVLATIVLGLDFDPCCEVLDCALPPPDWGTETETETETDTTSTTDDTAADSSTGLATTGTGTSEPGTTTGSTGQSDTSEGTGPDTSTGATDATTSTDASSGAPVTSDPLPTTTIDPPSTTGGDASTATSEGETDAVNTACACRGAPQNGALLLTGLVGLLARRRRR